MTDRSDLTQYILDAPPDVLVIDLTKLARRPQLVEYAKAVDLDLEDAAIELLTAKLRFEPIPEHGNLTRMQLAEVRAEITRAVSENRKLIQNVRDELDRAIRGGRAAPRLPQHQVDLMSGSSVVASALQTALDGPVMFTTPATVSDDEQQLVFTLHIIGHPGETKPPLTETFTVHLTEDSARRHLATIAALLGVDTSIVGDDNTETTGVLGDLNDAWLSFAIDTEPLQG